MHADPQDVADLAGETRASCAAWLRSMRTPGLDLGHFRYSEHAFHPWSLYGSNCALALWWRLGLPLSEAEREGWARIFLDRYRSELGLFLCPQLYGEAFRGDPCAPEDRRRADAAAPFKKVAAKLFRLTGRVPPVPGLGTLGFESVHGLEGFFETMRREQTPYSFGSTVGDFFQKRTLWLRGRGAPVKGDPWIEWGYGYVDRVRDAASGFMTGAGGDRASMMNGLFKLSCSSFWGHGRAMPDARKVVDTVLGLADPEGGFGESCNDYNATLLLVRSSLQEEGYRREEVLQALTGPVLARLEQRRRPDGGFSFHPAHCITRQNMYNIADPLPESDLVGTGQQVAILGALQAMVDGETSFSL